MGMNKRSSTRTSEATSGGSELEGAKRGQIVQALVNCIAEQGFERTTIRAVAERAGVSPGLLTYYFKDKKELVREAIDSAFTASASNFAEASSEFGPQRLHIVSSRYLRDGYPGALPLKFWIQVQAAAATDPEVRRVVSGWMLDGLTKTCQSVEVAMAAGQYDPAHNAERIGRLIYAAMTGLAVSLSVSPELGSADLAAEVMDLLLDLLHGWNGDAHDRSVRHLDTPDRARAMLARDPRLTVEKAERLATAFEAMYQLAVGE